VEEEIGRVPLLRVTVTSLELNAGITGNDNVDEHSELRVGVFESSFLFLDVGLG